VRFFFKKKEKNSNNRNEYKYKYKINKYKLELTCLRDKLYCMSDQMQQNESRMPSGFFFIENVFYNDFRSPLAIDYSQ